MGFCFCFLFLFCFFAGWSGGADWRVKMMFVVCSGWQCVTIFCDELCVFDGQFVSDGLYVFDGLFVSEGLCVSMECVCVRVCVCV